MMTFVFPAVLAAGLAATVVAWPASKPAIGIDNFAFSPARLAVSKGSEVTWTNHDDIPHSIVLGSIGVHSKAIDTDGSFAYRFGTPGTYNYICGLHPHMHGEIVVR